MGQLFLYLLLLFSGGFCNTIESLGRAGQVLAQLPINDDSTPNSAVSEVIPTFYDLAISRLQSKTDEVVTNVWDSLNNKRKLAQLSENGLATGVLKMFDLLRNDISAVEDQVSTVQSTLQKLTAMVGSKTPEWLTIQTKFSNILGKIKLHYTIFDDYMRNAETTNQLEIEDYARSIIQPGSTQQTAMLTTLDELNSMAIPDIQKDDGAAPRTDLLFKVLKILTGNKENLCDFGLTEKQYLMNLYSLIALAEIKGYMMVQFSYIVFKMYGHDSLTLESDVSRRKFSTNTAYKISFAKEILNAASSDLWHCDSQNPVEGVSYVRLTKLLQGHLENEVDMNTRGSCSDNCAAFQVAEPLGCYKDMFCAKQSRCQGRLFECQFFNADAWVCLSQDRQRKYDWVEYENGIELGEQKQCINKVKVDSWWRFLLHCSYCLCLCDSPTKESDRHWSLMAQMSDIDSNKIVTGVRFVKKNGIIHLEIEQATALKEGKVDDSSRQWVQSQNLDPQNSTQKSLGYFKTMSYEERALDIDRLEAISGHVITGVRFQDLGGHLNMEVRVTPIRFSSGQLISQRTVWIGNYNTPVTIKQRTLLEIRSPDVPTKRFPKSTIDSNKNQYLLFGATSAYKDVSQTTIPYIDSQPVAPQVGSWLSGVGLYHKGTSGSGGYVGAMIKTYDISRHLVSKKRDEQKETYILSK